MNVTALRLVDLSKENLAKFLHTNLKTSFSLNNINTVNILYYILLIHVIL